MGMSSDARLDYGLIIGYSEDSYGFEYDDPNKPSWIEAEDDDGDAGTAIERILLASVGFTEDDYKLEGFFQRAREAWERVGVKLVHTGSYEFPTLILSAKRAGRVEWGSTANLDLRIGRERLSLDKRLLQAWAALELDPAKAKPGWILSSMCG